MDVTRLMVVALDGWINHRERNHQGLENKIIEPEFGSGEQWEVNSPSTTSASLSSTPRRPRRNGSPTEGSTIPQGPNHPLRKS